MFSAVRSLQEPPLDEITGYGRKEACNPRQQTHNHHTMKNTIALYMIAIGVAVIALQNAGIIPPLKTGKTQIDGTVVVKGSVDVDNTVDVDVQNVTPTIDVNLSEIVGRQLVESVNGMFIGVTSTSNTLVPINWGEISIER